MDLAMARHALTTSLASISLAAFLFSGAAAEAPVPTVPNLDAEAMSTEPGAFWMRPLREHYPLEWAELKRRIAQGFATHPDSGNVWVTSVAFQQDFFTRKHDSVLRATPRALRTDVELNTNLLRSLQRDDPVGCALFEKTGSFSPTDPVARKVWVQIQISQLEGALINSAAEGDKSGQALPEPLSKNDLSYLAKHYLALGGEKNGFFSALSPRSSTLPPSAACAAAVLLGTVVSQAPDEILARYLATSRRNN